MATQKRPRRKPNTDQNRDFAYAIREAEKALDIKLSKLERRAIHDEITKKDFSYKEIIAISIEMYKDKKNIKT